MYQLRTKTNGYALSGGRIITEKRHSEHEINIEMRL
jgi:hypothetical protein